MPKKQIRRPAALVISDDLRRFAKHRSDRGSLSFIFNQGLVVPLIDQALDLLTRIEMTATEAQFVVDNLEDIGPKLCDRWLQDDGPEAIEEVVGKLKKDYNLD